jgi:hypothetical protein
VSARAVRLVVLAICAAGIAGMVVGSVADDNAVALVFGLVTAAAVACLIVATAVAGGAGVAGSPDEDQGRRVEELVAGLVGRGADEAEVRELVREAVQLGRGRPNSPRRGAAQTPDAEAGAEVHGGRTPRPGGRTFT